MSDLDIIRQIYGDPFAELRIVRGRPSRRVIGYLVVAHGRFVGSGRHEQDALDMALGRLSGGEP